MTNNTAAGGGTMAFDSSCGISEEEQREIFAQINSIAEKNRLAFSGAADDSGRKKKQRFKAKKSGGFFPILVNIIAVMALAGGLYALYVFHGKADAEVREGSMVYNSAERALIEEIRRETSSRLEAKENEISRIVSQLKGIDAELKELYSSSQELTAEQHVAENRLKATQEDFLATLAYLQDERSRILEEARAREATLQAQIESSARELAMVSEQSAVVIGLAQAELERLSKEQSQTAIIEAQMGALFANLNERISENRLEEAAGIIRSMRGFLNTPAFQGLRSMQARKELYAQTISTLDSMVDEARKNQVMLGLAGKSSAGELERTILDLQDENSLLRENVAGLTRTVEAATSQGSGLAERLNELGSQVQTLQAQNVTLQRQNADTRSEVAARDRTIASLEGENTNRNRTIAALEQDKAARDRTITTLEQDKTARDRTIATLETDKTTRDRTITALETDKTALNQTVTAREETITRQEETIANLNTQLVSIRQALQTLSQD